MGASAIVKLTSILNVVIWRARHEVIDRRSHGALTLIAVVTLAAFIFSSCRSVLSRKYEYDEDIHLALDGSATIYVNASVPALVALRGVDLDVDSRARLDRDKIRALFESPVTDVISTTASRRDNRRYVHVRIEVSDIQRLSEAGPFAWSHYVLERQHDVLKYRQAVGAAAGRDVGDVGWTGAELVAFRLHLPSQVPYHNSPTREIERGNIVVWEQALRDRMKGVPLTIEVHLGTESILRRTLILFAITVLLAAATFALAIWWVLRRPSAVRSA
jgi:hypothetical protein